MHAATIALFCAGCAMVSTAVAEESLDDPTRPSGTPSASILRPSGPHQLQLEGIFQRNGHCIAIVDGRVVHEGDRIANAKIEEITEAAVRYSRDGHDHTIRLTRNTLHVRLSSTTP